MVQGTYTLYDWEGYRGKNKTFAGLEYTLLASLDESRSCEVDQSAIYLTPDGKFAFATASGCSCWGGDWDVADFDSLDEIEKAYRSDDIHMYNPSLKGFDILMAEARAEVENLNVTKVAST